MIAMMMIAVVMMMMMISFEGVVDVAVVGIVEERFGFFSFPRIRSFDGIRFSIAVMIGLIVASGTTVGVVVAFAFAFAFVGLIYSSFCVLICVSLCASLLFSPRRDDDCRTAGCTCSGTRSVVVVVVVVHGGILRIKDGIEVVRIGQRHDID